jgi:hypothetical protein
MSGWNTADKMMDEDTGSDFPSINNISVAGYMPHDTVAAPGKLLPLHYDLIYLIQLNHDHLSKLTSSHFACSESTADTCPLLSITLATAGTQTPSRPSCNSLNTGVRIIRYAISTTSISLCVLATRDSTLCRTVMSGALQSWIRLPLSAEVWSRETKVFRP